MKVLAFNPGGESSNSYLLLEGKKAILVDAGTENPPKVGPFLHEEGIELSAVLLTHAHFDHIMGLASLKPACPVYVAKEDRQALSSPRLNGSRSFGFSFRLDETSLHIEEYPSSGELEIPPFGRIEVIFTPFHTEGSVCLYFPKASLLFSGDTLFLGSLGRYDLPGGDGSKVLASLAKLLGLPDRTTFYPGHGPKGNLGTEKRSNPYLREAEASDPA